MLRFLLWFTDAGRYPGRLGYYRGARGLLRFGLSHAAVGRLLGNAFLPFPLRLINKLSGIRENRQPIRRLRSAKISCIAAQERNYRPDPDEVEALEHWLRLRGVNVSRKPGADVHWNRYSFLRGNDDVVRELSAHGVEAGRFNWPRPLDRAYAGVRGVSSAEACPNSALAAEQIVNVPVWSDFFRRHSDRPPIAQAISPRRQARLRRQGRTSTTAPGAE